MSSTARHRNPYESLGFIQFSARLGPIYENMYAIEFGISRDLFNQAACPVDHTSDPRVIMANPEARQKLRDVLKTRDALAAMIASNVERQILEFLSRLDTRDGHPIRKDTTDGIPKGTG